jgi:hypothetical protein
MIQMTVAQAAAGPQREVGIGDVGQSCTAATTG